ncbi:MAG: hypothetical protein SFU53_04610 [Terrimicrobiaceae bacterium]|nr:hypothetical protein [Terrimicrobiaceae bacterium]
MNTLYRFLALLLVSLTAANAQVANIWHIPGVTQNGIPSTMRDPVNPAAGQSVTFYQGVWKGGGTNQTGGWFIYRFAGGSWQSVVLGYHSDVASGTQNHNQFWKATITVPSTAGTSVEYYFKTVHSNRPDAYVFGNNQTSGVETDAQQSPTSFQVAYPPPVLTVNGVNANYSKSNFYIDEINDSTFPQIEVLFSPNVSNLTDVEIFTNLNNRERAALDANSDSIEDGIIPPDGNLITTADTNSYFRAYAMENLGGGQYRLVLPVQKTGAYRLTGRFRVQGNPNWIWISASGYRDHAIVVAPKSAREMRMYELHVTNINATGPSFGQRGTFEDLHSPSARANLDWLRNLGINWIWFQPFHPQGFEGRQNDPATGSSYDPGSPYSIRNFWEINPLYTRNYDIGLPNPAAHPTNYAAAMTAFQNFAAAADDKGVQLMLDFPFNHTSPDVVLGQKGVEIFGGAGNPGNWQAGDQIRNRVPQFFSTNGNEGSAAYSAPAQNANNIATAPDRDDFGKWSDVRDVFFGRYATLVTGYPGADSSRATVRNEGDWMDLASLGTPTVNVWRYFGEVLPYWIVQSGHRGFNSTPSDGGAAIRESFDNEGIDGLRKDFGQGLPPQCMEYIINRTHSVKWNFVFMTESLDGGEVTYRSSRHFAVLNENIVFPLQQATTTTAYRQVFEDRRNAYGTSLVLLNNTSHDEAPYADSWEALIRYATVSTVDGSPMIMYGQEIGTGTKVQDNLPQGGFDWYELNFGKNIPNFKKWNSMQPQWTAWNNNAFGVQFLYPVYSGIGFARAFSPALRSNNRWFLNRQFDSQPNQQIFAVAKYSSPGTPASQQDVVLAFVNLDRNTTRSDTFRVSETLAGQLGLGDGRTYNVKNIAAFLGRNNEHPNRRDTWLWGGGRTGSDIRTNGVFVSLNPVPTTDPAWATAPYEAQFLKVYDVTQLPAPAAAPTNSSYALDGSVTFTWNAVTDPGGLTPLYRLTISRSDGQSLTVDTAATSYTLTGLPAGVTATATVSTLNPNNNSVASAPTSAGPQTLSLTSAGDNDGDGMSNASEVAAGTDPLNASSIFRVSSLAAAPGGGFTVTWNAVDGRTYAVESSTTLAPGSWTVLATGLTTGTFTDTSTTGQRRFYRVRLDP